MPGARSALIIASYDYSDTGLQRLRAPVGDARALAAVLKDPVIGNFEVRTLLNKPAHEVNLALEEFFDDRRPDDLLVVHFSGHGVKDESGDLYFAMADTMLRRLGSTAVAAEFVNRRMSHSRSRRVVLLLDCCYAGAFERGMRVKSDNSMGIESQFSGRGRAVITASSAMEYAMEGDELIGAEDQAPSVFTNALVEGLVTGEADRDQDGLVALDELYDYIFEKVRATTSNQTPGKWTFGVQGELIIARRSRPVTSPAQLPQELEQAIDSPLTSVRTAAVQELTRLVQGRHAGLALAGRLALEQLADDDSRSVAAAATAALGTRPKPEAPPRLQLSVTTVDFGEIPHRTDRPPRRIHLDNAGGGRLDARASTQADWLVLRQAGDELFVSVDTGDLGQHEGVVIVESNGGSDRIRVRARVTAADKTTAKGVHSQRGSVSAAGLGKTAAVSTPSRLSGGSPSDDDPAGQAERPPGPTTIPAGTIPGALNEGTESSAEVTEEATPAAVVLNPGKATEGDETGSDQNITGKLANMGTVIGLGSPRPDPADKEAPKAGSLNRRRFAAIAGISILAIAGIVLAAILIPGGHSSYGFVTLADPGSSGIQALAFDRDGAKLATGDGNGNTYLWNVSSRRKIATLTDSGTGSVGVQAVAFSPNGEVLATGDYDGKTYLWNVATGDQIATLTDPETGPTGVQAVAFSPDGKTLATGDSNGSAYLWDFVTKRVTSTLTDPQTDGVQAIAFSPGGKTLAVGDNSGTTYLWAVETGNRTAALSDPSGGLLNAIAFSPDGKMLATGDYDGSTYLWSISAGLQTATLTDPESGTNGVRGVAFSPDSKTLATGDGNGSSYLWDVPAGHRIATLPNPRSQGVAAVAFSPDGETLAAGDANGRTYLWSVG